MVTLVEMVNGRAQLADARTGESAAPTGRLMRTFRTRAYLSRAGHVRLDEVLAQ